MDRRVDHRTTHIGTRHVAVTDQAICDFLDDRLRTNDDIDSALVQLVDTQFDGLNKALAQAEIVIVDVRNVRPVAELRQHLASQIRGVCQILSRPDAGLTEDGLLGSSRPPSPIKTCAIMACIGSAEDLANATDLTRKMLTQFGYGANVAYVDDGGFHLRQSLVQAVKSHIPKRVVQAHCRCRRSCEAEYIEKVADHLIRDRCVSGCRCASCDDLHINPCAAVCQSRSGLHPSDSERYRDRNKDSGSSGGLRRDDVSSRRTRSVAGRGKSTLHGLSLTGMTTVTELYALCASCDVEIRLHGDRHPTEKKVDRILGTDEEQLNAVREKDPSFTT